ncbi:MAG: DUF4397 domain-containing protein [Halobacteriaceae archaeon]
MAAETFNVRIGHFIPDAPHLDFLVDGHPVLTDRGYGDLPPYSEHRADEYEVTVQDTDSGEQLVRTSITFEPDTYHTLLVVGTVTDPGPHLLTDGPSSLDPPR